MKPINIFGLGIVGLGVYRLGRPAPVLAGIKDPTYERNTWIIIAIGILIALFGDKQWSSYF